VTTPTATDDAVRAACAAAGLDSSSLAALHHHATAVYLLSSLDVVVRVSRGEDRQPARSAVAIATWLAEQGVPAITPALVEQPVEVEDVAVTFWRYYPQHPDRPKPGAGSLGSILRQLHELPAPPFELPRYQPLTRLGTVLAGPTRLGEADHAWLDQCRRELLTQYAQLSSTLGEGFIHGDAYPGNTLWDGDRVILGDWDEVATGPRELDLINTHQGARMGRTEAERDAFTAAYGWDVTTWDGYPILRAMRDLHTLAAFIERADAGDQAAANEVEHRIATLRAGDTAARWHSA
jgi:aminoglycoside phosphotransferase (APT) family kinase protein